MNRCSRCSGELPAFAVFCPHCAQPHEPNFYDMINLTIDGRYHIYRRLGQGGLSTVFAATDLETDDVVVIKISNPAQLVRREMSYAMEANRTRGYWDEMLERMRREAEMLATIDHPNIVGFNGTGMINDDLRYVAMEFLRGRTLRDEMDRGGVLDPSKATRIALEVASALIEVHSRGIVHRDINPRNIMIAECAISDSGATDPNDTQSMIRTQSIIKLIDFGIAKFPQPAGAPPFTLHATLAGTVAYASPEQCSSHSVDYRSDIYSLGSVLYEMVTGQRPFNGRTPTEIALKQIQSEPRPPRSINPAITVSLEKTILRSLAKNPSERHQSVRELAAELSGSPIQIFAPLGASLDDPSEITLSRNVIAHNDEIGADDEAADSKLKHVRSRRRRLVAAAAALLIIACAAAILLGRPSFSSGRKASNVAGIPNADASPAPETTPGIGSDADSMELAANQQSKTANPANPANQQGKPANQQPNGSDQSAVNIAANHKDVARSVIPPTPAPAPAPIPPKAKPQMPPAPAPEIAITRAPQPGSEPDLSQGPDKDHYGGGWRRGDEMANNDPNRGSNTGDDRDLIRDEDQDSNRRHNKDVFNRRRPSDTSSRDDSNRNDTGRNDAGRNDTGRNSSNRNDRDSRGDDDNSDTIAPKVIQWSGRVNNEREITIEMPGVPGTVEIPRAYRDRVGIIEPPNTNNRWRCATLRVFGRGGVSFVVRWWPAARNIVKITARK